MEIRGALILWNAFLAVFSIMGALRTWTEFLHVLSEHGIHHSLCILRYEIVPENVHEIVLEICPESTEI